MIDLFECLGLSCNEEAGLPRVDRANGIIRNVKLLGWHSANGREYDPDGVDPALYEGRPVNCDHVRPGQQGSVKDTIGWLTGAHKRPDGTYAREFRLLNPAGEFEQRVMSAAEHAPHLFGMSHTAKGQEKPGSAGSIIEKVHKVESVDLVRDPATVSSFYESRGFKVKIALKALAESLKATRPGYSRALTEVAEAGIMGPDAQMDAAQPAPGATPEEPVDHCQALLDAAKAVLDDAALDTPAKIDRIKKILTMIDSGNGGDPDEPDEPEEDETKESRRLARLEARERLREAADEANVKLPRALLESISPTITVAQAKALVASLEQTPAPAARFGAQSAPPWVEPKPTTPVQESRTQPAQTSPEARAKRVASLRGR